MTKFKLAINQEEREFKATRQGDVITVQMEAETATLHLISQDDNTILLEKELPNGRRQRIRLAGAKDGDKRQLWVNGRHLTAERVRQRGSGSSADTSLAASIPAVVSEILVNVGDAVADGDKLILLESMKMVIPIQAPYAGTVTAVNCAAGESVQAGVQLIELEKSGD